MLFTRTREVGGKYILKANFCLEFQSGGKKQYYQILKDSLDT